MDRTGFALHVGVALLVCAALGAQPAAAQSAEAEAKFSEGETLLAAGKIAEACDAFAASNKLEPRAGTLINLGTCRESNHQYASAATALKDALARVKDPKKRQVAEAKLKAIEPLLSYLTITVADASRVAGLAVTRDGVAVDSSQWNQPVPVDGGHFVITGSAPDHDDWSSTVEVRDEADKVSVDVPALEPVVKVVAPVAPVTPVVPVVPVATGLSGKRKVAIGLAAVGVGAVVAGIVLGRSAKALEDDALALCPDPDIACSNAAAANAKLDRGDTRALQANLAFGVAAGATAGAVVLWLMGAPRAESQVTVAPRATGNAVGFTVFAGKVRQCHAARLFLRCEISHHESVKIGQLENHFLRRAILVCGENHGSNAGRFLPRPRYRIGCRIDGGNHARRNGP